MGFNIPFVDTSPPVFYKPSQFITKGARNRSQSFSRPEAPSRSTSSTPSRPTHRRAHSALPASLASLPSGFNTTLPLSASTERPRSHKRSQSALSLPVLAETHGSWPGLDAEPDLADALKATSLDGEDSFPFPRPGSSVPPPQRMAMATSPSSYSVPRPIRPPTSPRVANPPAKPTHLTHSRRNSAASVSDLNVLATWSFPPVDTPPQRGRQPTRHVGSEGLRQRLRTLSALDTKTLPASATVPSHLAPTNSRPSTPPSLPANLRTSMFFHRHTFSSPTPHKNDDASMPPPPLPMNHDRKAPGPMLPPPPRPTRRPTTSRLRQPMQLSMSQDQPSLVPRRSSQSLNISLSSSPGSLLSDTSSTRSPTPSFVSLPGQADGNASTTTEREVWWGSGTPWKGPARWRRPSMDSCSIHSTGTEPDMRRMAEIYRADSSEGDDGDDDDEEDIFLTMDDA